MVMEGIEEVESLESLKSKFNMHRLEKYYKLKNLVRFNQMSRSSDENVAEHSYYVSLFSLLIADFTKSHFDVDNDLMERCLVLATLHDFAEIWTTDVSYEVKAKSPDIKKALLDLESDELLDHVPEVYKLILQSSSDDTLVKCIVKMADHLSVIQYAQNQIKLGNTYFDEVQNQAIHLYLSRLSEYTKLLRRSDADDKYFDKLKYFTI